MEQIKALGKPAVGAENIVAVTLFSDCWIVDIGYTVFCCRVEFHNVDSFLLIARSPDAKVGADGRKGHNLFAILLSGYIREHSLVLSRVTTSLYGKHYLIGVDCSLPTAVNISAYSAV